MTEYGILYVAVDQQTYVDQAIVSMKSIRRFNSNLSFALVTNLEVNVEMWDLILAYEPPVKLEKSNYMLPKLYGLLHSPFKNTIYLDTDTFVLDNISCLFELLTRYQFAYTLSHACIEKDLISRGKIKAKDGHKYQILGEDFPSTFYALQGGLFCFKKSVQMSIFFKKVYDDYIKTGFYDDQAIIRRNLWFSDIRAYCLPRSFNFNSLLEWILWRYNKYKHLKPIVWHYTLHKHLQEKNFYEIERIFSTKSFIILILRVQYFRLKRKFL